MTPDSQPVVALRDGGVSVVLDTRGDRLPVVVHWGADVGTTDAAALAALVEAAAPVPVGAALEVPVRVALLPERAAGYRGRPALSGARTDGSGWSPLFRTTALDVAGGTVTVEAVDEDAGLALHSSLALSPAGVLEVAHELTNTGSEAYALEQLACVLPVAPVATEILDLSGRWCHERDPQRTPFNLGAWVRETRHGRTGHDAPTVLAVGTSGFGFRHGEVWTVHFGWSGDAAVWAERGPAAPPVVATAELLGPGEVVLGPGESYRTPTTYAAWSDRGLDGAAAAFHAHVRARPGHPRKPRPVVLNTWEAVYFDHRLERLTELADTAAGIGVERFVLDDGWFRHRRDDTAGLGDWYVDETVWPDGLTPLVAHVRGLGMEFGLWVEPEMVNLDSDLARAHPDWVLGPPGRTPPPWRNQQVLDVAHPGAYDYLLERLDALLTDHDIGYLKWDHNRDLVDAEHGGRPGVHAQTLAVYRLLDELRARHPDVEIESCSSGGGRVDLGILERTDRVWASDTNDALERQSIQRWTQQLLPPELVGAHVGPPRAHTTHRTQALSFRAATALFGHFGIEWDVASASAEERAGLAEAVALYRESRALLHSGAVVRVDHPDPAALVHGVVAADRSAALFGYVQLTMSSLEAPGLVRLAGLDPDRSYRVEPVLGALAADLDAARPVPWVAAGGVTLPGAVLESVGLQVPRLYPEQALLLRLS